MFCWLKKLWRLITGGGPSLCCRQMTEFLMAYLDGELEPEVAARFESHLAACSACRTFLDSYRKTIALGKDALCGPDAPVVPEDLTKAILAARRK